MRPILYLLSTALLSLSFLLPNSAVSIEDDPEALLRQGHFSDVPQQAWYAEAAAWAKVSGVLEGTSKSTFSPEEAITRSQFLAALHRLKGSPSTTGESSFSDVTPHHRDYSALLWALETEIATGFSPSHFAPDTPLTRQQATLFLFRCAMLSRFPETITASTFSDWDTVAPWAAEAISWGIETGLLIGLPGPSLAPEKPVTRAQAAVLLMRYTKLLEA